MACWHVVMHCGCPEQEKKHSHSRPTSPASLEEERAHGGRKRVWFFITWLPHEPWAALRHSAPSMKHAVFCASGQEGRRAGWEDCSWNGQAGKGRSRRRHCSAGRFHEKCNVILCFSKWTSVWHFKQPEMASKTAIQEWLLHLHIGNGY